ncbi:MAG: molybdopterin molybdotransferase MoeA [Bacteroidetes bacterium]|nr:molybdopterin molybdotransferase MoeA [Bacteroidota bacterium]
MILFEEALALVLENVPVLPSEEIPFMESIGRVLAAPVTSDLNMPPFDKSAMDGFAFRMSDMDKELLIRETIPAGKVPEKAIGEGQCSKIMTGAMIPQGADAVVPVEDTEPAGRDSIRILADKVKTNISRLGEDVREGDIVLTAGTWVQPPHIAVMASVGCTKPRVAVKPKIGIISTGDELVEPDEKPGPSQIRNSNSWQLLAQAKLSGAEPYYYGIAPDTEDESYRILDKAIHENQVVLLTGGVSMGDFDFIPKVFRKLGIRIIFETVAMQPGKPTVFGHLGDKRIFGLPGNPVSSYNTFNIFVKPMIRRMMGMKENDKRLILPMGVTYQRKRSDRMSWIPVSINREGFVIPLEYHGSGHIHSLSSADGMIAIPIGETILKEGARVHVRQL